MIAQNSKERKPFNDLIGLNFSVSDQPVKINYSFYHLTAFYVRNDCLNYRLRKFWLTFTCKSIRNFLNKRFWTFLIQFDVIIIVLGALLPTRWRVRLCKVGTGSYGWFYFDVCLALLGVELIRLSNEIKSNLWDHQVVKLFQGKLSHTFEWREQQMLSDH